MDNSQSRTPRDKKFSRHLQYSSLNNRNDWKHSEQCTHIIRQHSNSGSSLLHCIFLGARQKVAFPNIDSLHRPPQHGSKLETPSKSEHQPLTRKQKAENPNYPADNMS